MRLFDSHTHLQIEEFDRDREEVIARAREAGVARMLVLGVDVETSERAIALAEAHDGVLAAAGCHPHDARFMDEASLARLAGMATHPRVVAVGEIGLDFYRNLSEDGKQTEVFRRQLETAAEVEKPVAVHCRDAQKDVYEILDAWSRKLGGRLDDGRPLGVMHYFSGNSELAQRFHDLGFMISIHCSVTYPRNAQLQEVAREMPLDTLLVETDSPYSSPRSRRGQRNEPANVIEAVEMIASLRGEPVERVAEATSANAMRLFALPEVATVAQRPMVGGA